MAPGDTNAFSETYDTSAIGTGKTLTPSGVVNDGNGGADYAVSFANNTTGVITTRAITVTAATNSKPYDGTTTSSGTPTITVGSLATGDTVTLTQTFNSKNAGTNRVITPAINFTNGSAANYTITFVPKTNQTITPRAITVTAATNTKVYDGTTSATAIPTITTGSLVGTDTTNFTESYSNAGSGQPQRQLGLDDLHDRPGRVGHQRDLPGQRDLHRLRPGALLRGRHRRRRAQLADSA